MLSSFSRFVTQVWVVLKRFHATARCCCEKIWEFCFEVLRFEFLRFEFLRFEFLRFEFLRFEF